MGIARALLRDPRLLILDEATASLDLAAEGFSTVRALDPRPLLVSHHQLLARCHRRVTIAGGRLLPGPPHRPPPALLVERGINLARPPLARSG